MGQILYLDETENDDYFIVAGLLANSPSAINKAYKKFKHLIRNYSYRLKEKEAIFNEFKSTILDKRYQKVKKAMLKSLNSIDYGVYYGIFKKGGAFRQEDKEREYIRIASAISSACECDIEVVFDSFHKKNFEERVAEELGSLVNVTSAVSAESFNEPGIQYADNLCSAIRRHMGGLDPDYYEYIAKKLNFVK